MTLPDSGAEPVVHILVADDEPHIGHIIKLKLEQGPYRVHYVPDGRKALEAFETQSFSAVLLDVMMPHVTGLEVLEKLRARGFDGPILIITAKGQDADRRQAYELGADAFFVKPFSPKRLLARIDSMLAVKPAQRPLDRCLQYNEELLRENRRLREQIAARRQGRGAKGGTGEPADDIIGALVGSVAHALKGELSNVAFRVDLLKMQDPPEEFLPSFEVIERSVVFSHLLVQNLVAHLDLGHYAMEPVNLSAQAVRAAELMRDRLADEISLALELPANNAPVWVRGDPEQLLSVLVELVRNASRAMVDKDGTITLTVSAEGADATVEVRDEGPGIPPELLETLGREPVHSRRGHGIGLYLIGKTIRQMSGTLVIENGAGGARVTITLPRDPGTAEVEAAP